MKINIFLKIYKEKLIFLPQMCPAKYLKSVKLHCFLEVKIRVFP